MSPPIIAFFNSKGGVGTTSLVYHVAWMLAEQGRRVVAVDLDPQANLTSAFLTTERLEELWPDGHHPDTIFGAIQPILEGIGDIKAAHVERIADGVSLLVGDLVLSSFEDELSSQWPGCLDRKERAFRVISAFWRIVDEAAARSEAEFVLLDVGPNLGALNRAVLVAADHVVIPLAPDLFSLQGLRNLGPTLRRWREQWGDRRARNPKPNELALPGGAMKPAGYVILQHGVRLDRPVEAYARWIRRIPSVYREAVLDQPDGEIVAIEEDPHCIALVKHYHSLVPMAQEARKPIFLLKPADGAIGAHLSAAHRAYADFGALTRQIVARVGGG
ncbi:MAG: ParA family protein [Egibacteraceae bacterium]